MINGEITGRCPRCGDASMSLEQAISRLDRLTRTYDDVSARTALSTIRIALGR